MTTTIELDSLTSSLTTRAMLVDLTVRQWRAAKQDRAASTTVSTAYQSSPRMGHYYKRLLDSDAHAEINRVATAAYAEHIKRTLPWFDNGQRVLSSMGYFDYMTKMTDYINDFNVAVTKFIQGYHASVNKARLSLNSLFNESDYPPASVISSKFSMDITILPLPDAGDFRVTIGDQDDIRTRIDSHVRTATELATQDLAGRIHNAVSHMANRLKAYNGGREGSFRDTMVANVQELVDLIPSLNFTNDANINALHHELADLCLYSPQDLRKDELARETTTAAADAILKKMQSIL